MVFKFTDMNSGGFTKSKYKTILIDCDNETEAIELFEARFDRHPRNITCNCCGYDYSISDFDSLEDATALDRMCQMSQDYETFQEKPSTDEDAEYFSKFNKYVTFDEYIEFSTDVLVIKAVDVAS